MESQEVYVVEKVLATRKRKATLTIVKTMVKVVLKHLFSGTFVVRCAHIHHLFGVLYNGKSRSVRRGKSVSDEKKKSDLNHC